MTCYAKIGVALLPLCSLLFVSGSDTTGAQPQQVEQVVSVQGQQVVEQVQPQNFDKYIPPHVGSGDREFNGHGPVVNVRVDIFVRNGQLWARMQFHAIENRSDFTECSGTQERVIFTPAQGRVVALAQGQESLSTLNYTDDNHEDDVFARGPLDPVREYRCSGDRKGDDAGVHTGAALQFNRISVVIER